MTSCWLLPFNLLGYCIGQNTNIVRHFVLFSDYVITINVITSRAIIATPSVRRMVRRCVRLSPSVGHTSDILRTYSGQTPDTSMDTRHNPGPSAGRYSRRVNTTQCAMPVETSASRNINVSWSFARWHHILYSWHFSHNAPCLFCSFTLPSTSKMYRLVIFYVEHW